jgi:hypothetical protein
MVKERKRFYEEKTKTGRTKCIEYREIMKADFLSLEECITDQERGMEYPLLSKPAGPDDEIIPLPAPEKGILKKDSIFDCISDRKSRRTQKRWTPFCAWMAGMSS